MYVRRILACGQVNLTAFFFIEMSMNFSMK